MRTAVRGREDLDYVIFVKRIAEKTGVDLGAYKRKQMERRLRSLASQCGASSLREFFHMLERDPSLLELLWKRMTINVSELFRNPDKFVELEKNILPRLAARAGRLRVWSAGCSYGAEAYSVAMLLEELSSPWQGPPILATDIDEEMLARAREGVFSEADMKNVSRARRRRFFVQGEGQYRGRPEVRRLVEFREHDLLQDDFEGRFHLVLCRNVVIYFTDEAKDRLYRKFFDSLTDGGVLFIGGTERIFGAEAIGFKPISAFFYEKPMPPGRRE